MLSGLTHEVCKGGRRDESGMRQPISPNDSSPPGSGPTKANGGGNGHDSELERHREAGMRHFRSNRLSEAVDAQSAAIRAGLEELTHRREMVARITGHRDPSDDGHGQDDLLLRMGESLAEAHTELGTTLEVAQKYPEAKVEWDNAI